MYVGAYVGVPYVGMTIACLNSRAASTCCRPASSTTAMAAAPETRAAAICRGKHDQVKDLQQRMRRLPTQEWCCEEGATDSLMWPKVPSADKSCR